MAYTTSSPEEGKSSSFRVNTQYQILTPTGFQTFDGIRRQEKPTLRMTFANGDMLEATPEHLIWANDGWKSLKDCVPGDYVLDRDAQSQAIVSVEPADIQYVYDPINVSGGHAFISGPVISHNCSFLSTAYTLIRADVLQNLKHAQPILTTEDGYQEYVAPKPGRVYCLTVDTASGQGADYSAFVITDVTTMPYVVVASYRNNQISSLEFPNTIMGYANKYFLPWIMVEVNDIGRDVANILARDYEYPHLMTTIVEKRLGQKLTFNTSKNRSSGVRMSAGVKRSGAAILKALIEKEQLILNDYRLIQELSVFVQKGAIFGAEQGHNDDMVMATLILAWVSIQPNFASVSEHRAVDVLKELFKATANGTTQVYPPRIEEDIPEEEAPTPVGVFGPAVGGDDDSSWLLN